MTARPRWLALDVGGANLKAAHSDGPVRSEPFAVWKYPERLAAALGRLADGLPPFDRLALTMTAELCDCFIAKAQGVKAVLDAVRDAFPGRRLGVWGVDGRFHSPESMARDPSVAAASNWLALATVAARSVGGPGLVVDVGSTTADLVPVGGGRVAALGRTDTQRLQSGELVYAGVRRTPVCALAAELPVGGVPTGLAAELFATTLDVYLVLGDVPPDPTDRETADGRPATREAARDRLARMVGADRETFSEDDALELARAADAALLDRLAASAARACAAAVGPPRSVAVAGSGAFLARRLADRLLGPGGAVVDLEAAWGPAASSAGCAWALAILAAERGDEAGP